ncbi:hypothetical protein [Siminovitchia terrae]|uniref:hypothetical protein n=1 Tax=Siminovitchia terrae TaxID=1914933 RepID=UPI0028A9B2B0|nr:hypothetical protein [Siminovitchia terrae]
MDKGLLKGLNLDLSYKVPDITDIGRQLDIQMDDINDHISEMKERLTMIKRCFKH